MKKFTVTVDFEFQPSHYSKEAMEAIVKKWLDNVWDDENTPRVIVSYKVKP